MSRRLVRRGLLLLLGLAAAGLVLAKLRPPEVEVATVARKDVTRVLALTGRVEPLEVVRVVPLVSARIVEQTREEGERVRSGELLARLDDREPKAAWARTQAALEARRAELALARRSLRRARRLRTADAISIAQLDADRSAFEVAARDVQRLTAERDDAEAVLAKYVLRASLSGWVLRRLADPGQTVTPQTTIYEIATARAPRVVAEVDERYLGELRRGMEAWIRPAGARQEVRYRAVIERIPRLVDPATGAADLYLRLLELPKILPAGLSIDVNVLVARHPGALTVPREAVIRSGKGARVHVLRQGRVQVEAVSIIDWPAARVVVERGLRAGDQVLLDPSDAPPGHRVRARTAPARRRRIR